MWLHNLNMKKQRWLIFFEMEPHWQIYWVSNGFGGESSFANVYRMATIIRIPIEQFGDIYVKMGMHLATREY